jgi:hypothetical protein
MTTFCKKDGAVPATFSRVLLASTALVAVFETSAAAFAEGSIADCTSGQCSSVIRGKMLDNGASGTLPVGENTERGSSADAAAVPFSISVDGQVVDESGQPRPAAIGENTANTVAGKQRKTDVDLSAVDIQVKFDGLDTKTMLNVSTVPIRKTYQTDEAIVFQATSNYPAFVQKAEIRITDSYTSSPTGPVAILPIDPNGRATWTMPEGDVKDFDYVLRVYDAQGRFDETEALMLSRSDSSFEPAAKEASPVPGLSEDRTAVRNIPVHGGAVTVYGRNVPEGYGVSALGTQVPTDKEHAFVIQRILPPGDHAVDVSLGGISKSGRLNFSRDIHIPQNEWFYVALADLTVGRKTGDPDIKMARDGEYDRVYTNGRLAFYLKGKIKGEYLLTASADTGEDDVRNLFKGMDSKSNEEVLRRIDPEEYYPVYGDSSTSVEDAPTNGKFYVRLSKGNSHVTWGNFKTDIEGSGFVQSDRALYGAEATYVSPDVTSFGEKRTAATVYGAQPESVAQRDEFLATGGSAYFLNRQDITAGSETVTVEYRNSVTGAVVSEEALVADQDYSLGYFQGLLLLRKALSQSSLPTGAVRSSTLGTQAYLVVQYEYTPLMTDIDGYAHGARVQRWVNDKVRLGLSETTDKSGSINHTIVGADIRLRHSETTFLDAEIAGSKGKGLSTTTSTDGGLTSSVAQKVGTFNRAGAWSMRGELDLADVGVTAVTGKLSGAYENRAEGFAEVSDSTSLGIERWDLRSEIDVSEAVKLSGAHEELKNSEGKKSLETSAEVAWQINKQLKITTGATLTDLHSPSAIAAGKSGYDGSRIDGGLRADYEIDDDRSVYAFGQGTLRASGDIRRNDRIGVGGRTQLTEKVGATAEISEGTTGLGGAAGLDYSPTADDKYYVGYRLDPDRATALETANVLSGTDRGVFTAGSRKKLTEEASAFAESSYDLYGRRKSLAQTYGVNYTPDELWTVDTALTTGSINDETIDATTNLQRSDFDRQAISSAVSYKDTENGWRGRIKGEIRHDDSADNTRDSNTYVLASNFAVETSESWRMLADLDMVVSDGNSEALSSGDYIETSLGFAYRPIDNDRFNALFRYTYLYDLPGIEQATSVTSSEEALKQRSHIVSADLSYDLLPWITVGTKQALRFGEVSEDSLGSDWSSSLAYLGTLKGDLHVVKNWDALVEGRMLSLPYAGTTDYGFLTAVYRHVGDNFKVGAGYNFGRFTDDLRDMTLDDRGVFLNLVGTY